MRAGSLAGAAGAGWLAGAAAQMHQPQLFAAHVYWALAAAAALLGGLTLAALRRRPGAARISWLALVLGGACIASAALAFSSTGLRALERLSHRLPGALEGVDVAVTGVVSGLPQRMPWGWRFPLEPESASLRGETVSLPPTLLLSWYEPPVTARQPRPGDRLRLSVRLRAPHGNANPHGFDQELHLFERGVHATGTVRDRAADAPELLDTGVGEAVARARQRVKDAIDARVSDTRRAGLITALAVGDQSAIDGADWRIYRRSGVAHLVSISGLHVTMFAWAAGLAIGWLWRRASLAGSPGAQRWGGLAAAVAYAVFAGWGVPAQRTIAMLACVALTRSLGLRWPWPLGWGASAVFVVALDPWAILQPGFWLSFAAVGLLLLAGSREPERADAGSHARGLRTAWHALRSAAAGVMRTQILMSAGLAPLSLALFGELSVVGWLANLVAIPLVTLLLTPLALAGVLLPPLWDAAAVVAGVFNAGLEALAALPFATVVRPAAPLAASACACAAVALLASRVPMRVGLLAAALTVPLILPATQRPAPGRFDLLALDVGQGSAVLVRTARHVLLYDTGPGFGGEALAGERVVLPVLRALGHTTLDVLMLSHRDSDHVGGAPAVIEGVRVRHLLGSIEPDHPLRLQALRAGATARECVAGQRWEWDGVRFELLHPGADEAARAGRPNARSCVLRVSDAHASALLAGDIEREQEAALVVRDAAALRADVLLVPHHGSKTSSSAGFLDAVSPRTAVVQAGYRNRFGHPAPPVLERYAQRGIGVVSTVSCGAWHWDGADSGECLRASRRRYWQHPDPSPATPLPARRVAHRPKVRPCSSPPSTSTPPRRQTTRCCTDCCVTRAPRPRATTTSSSTRRTRCASPGATSWAHWRARRRARRRLAPTR